jgi:hypothetical protein
MTVHHEPGEVLPIRAAKGKAYAGTTFHPPLLLMKVYQKHAKGNLLKNRRCELLDVPGAVH